MILINFHLVLFASTPPIAGRMFSLSFIISSGCIRCPVSFPLCVCSLAFIMFPYNIDRLLVIIKHTSHDVWECISVSEQRPTNETWIDKDWWQQDDIIEYKKVCVSNGGPAWDLQHLSVVRCEQWMILWQLFMDVIYLQWRYGELL